MSKGLFIFHRDFRIYDNITLNEMVDKCEEVNCCFIFNPEQVTSKNDFKSDNDKVENEVAEIPTSDASTSNTKNSNLDQKNEN